MNTNELRDLMERFRDLKTKVNYKSKAKRALKIQEQYEAVRKEVRNWLYDNEEGIIKVLEADNGKVLHSMFIGTPGGELAFNRESVLKIETFRPQYSTVTDGKWIGELNILRRDNFGKFFQALEEVAC